MIRIIGSARGRIGEGADRRAAAPDPEINRNSGGTFHARYGFFRKTNSDLASTFNFYYTYSHTGDLDGGDIVLHDYFIYGKVPFTHAFTRFTTRRLICTRPPWPTEEPGSDHSQQKKIWR